jgi:hypothetical protein
MLGVFGATNGPVQFGTTVTGVHMNRFANGHSQGFENVFTEGFEVIDHLLRWVKLFGNGFSAGGLAFEHLGQGKMRAQYHKRGMLNEQAYSEISPGTAKKNFTVPGCLINFLQTGSDPVVVRLS